MMANIMLTDTCNLHCPYCFANEFVNYDQNEISMEAFRLAKEFILGDGTHDRVGLIGGEPTTHSCFESILRDLYSDERVKRVVLYTNGVFLDKYLNLMTHPKMRILVNCNSKNDIGRDNFRRIRNNLDELILSREFRDPITLGINMYHPEFDYSYIIELLLRYKMNHVRVSITVPNLDATRNTDAYPYFESIKPRMTVFFEELLENGIVPNFDCNKIPHCLVSDDDIKILKKYLSNPKLKKLFDKSNLSNSVVTCRPVIDIRQDLTAVRCFGLSSCTKQKITDFANISDLENYYTRTVDAFACNTVYAERCINCQERKVMHCYGGCLAFKQNALLELNNYSNSFMNYKEEN